jgi:predicted transcriptional regulator
MAAFPAMVLSMRTQSIDIDELDRRWEAFLAQDSVATNDDVTRWLQTWGTPAFRSWQSRKSVAPSSGTTG